jgi:4-amino-4-deoxy-L-arabinose transferase-like glycosyltransferase
MGTNLSLLKNYKTDNNRLTWFGVIFVIIIVGIIRYNLLDVPFERDEGEYAYAGQLLIEGLPLYQNLHTLKFPGTHFAYSILLTLFNHTHQGIHLGLLIINAITILLVFLLSKNLMKPLGAWFAAASFAVLSLSTSVLGIFAHAEHFVILFSTAGLLCLLRAHKNKSMWLFFGSGLLLAIGSLMKQNGFFFIGSAAIFILLDYLTKQPRQRQQLFWQYALFTAGLLTTYGMLFVYLVLSGSLENFWFDTFIVSGEYVSKKSFF